LRLAGVMLHQRRIGGAKFDATQRPCFDMGY
jgi:hypothetical protein